MAEIHDPDKSEQEILERATKMLGQLGNWTMTANAGGIAYVLTVARDSKVPLSLLGGAYLTFIVGIVCGFLGHLFIAVSGGATAAVSGRLRIAEEGLERRAGIQADRSKEGKGPIDFADLDKADQKIVDDWSGSSIIAFAGVFGGIGTLLYIAAAVCAVLGLTAPLTLGLFS